MNFKTEWFDQLASTNALMHERACSASGMTTGTIIAAKDQTAGRGRSNRKWLSKPDTNLCFSLYINSDAAPIQLPSLTMAVALAVSELLADKCIAAKPKWPNDVLVKNKKICGILSERVDAVGTKGMIIGIGLNINMSSAETDLIDRPATSMLIESGKAFRPDQILSEFFPFLAHWIAQWQSGYFLAFRENWIEKAGPIGKSLAVHDGESIKTGTLAGFGNHGELLLKTENGIETIWAGDVEEKV